MDVKSFFFQGIGNSAKGIAMVGGACRRDGFAVNINSLWTEENSELNTARVWVHELGHQVGIKAIHSYSTNFHQVGMFHDFSNHHGGTEGTCDGLMHYGDNIQFSDCSNSDFEIWYRRTGHKCSDPLAPPSSFKGLLIVGSQGSGRAAELIDLNTKQQCRITDLPERRWHHAQIGDIICGGASSDIWKSCVSVTDSTKRWTMLHRRYQFSMWKRPDGRVLVIGGLSAGGYSTEVLTNEGASEESFRLRYYSR